MSSPTEPISPTQQNTGDSFRSIMRSALRFCTGTVLSRATGLFRDIALAFSFGTHASLAAFFVSFRLAQTCRRLFGEGALQSAFVPLFEKIRKEDSQRAIFFFRDLNVLWICLLSLFICTSMSAIFIFLTWGSCDPSSYEVWFLTLLMLPSLLPICLFGLNISLLQCEKKFFIAGAAPAAFNIVISLAALLLHSKDAQSAMPYLSGAVVVGCVLQWATTFLPVMRSIAHSLVNGFLEKLHLFSQDVKQLWKPLSFGILGVGASQINSAVDALFSRYADLQGPAYLWFSIRIQQLPLALFGIALSGALLPPLARAIQAKEREKYLSFLSTALRKSVALLTPCTALLMVAGDQIVSCLYGRGDFQAHSIITTTSCLQGYALALVPTGLKIIFASAFYAQQNYSIPMKGAVLSLIINTALNAVFVFCFGLQALSIALATSIAEWINAGFLSFHLKKTTGMILSSEARTSCLKLALCSCAAFCGTYVLFGSMYTWPFLFGWTNGASSQYVENIYLQLTSLIGLFLLFAGLLLGCARLLRAQDQWRVFSSRG